MPDYVITSPHSKDVDLGDDDKKIQSYIKSISVLSNIDIYTEISNVMSAIHNLKFISINMHPLQKFELNAAARDLNTKVILIGISVIGSRVADIAEKFLALAYELDEKVNEMSLSPAKHGEQLINLLNEKFSKIDWL